MCWSEAQEGSFPHSGPSLFSLKKNVFKKNQNNIHR